MDLPSADVCIEETRNDPRVLCLQACLYLHGEGKANFFTAILLTAVLIIFLAAYSQWSEKFIPWPCQSWKGQISFIFLLTPLFHLLQAALCLSITRLHCFLMRCLWPFASFFLCFWLQESETGLLILWPAVLFLHTCSLSLPGCRTGSHFCFSAADRKGEAALAGGRQSFKALRASLAGVNRLRQRLLPGF